MVHILGKNEAMSIKCDDPECNHSGKDHEMFVNQHCHEHAGLQLLVSSGLLKIWCTVCSDPVVGLRVDDSDIDGIIMLDGEEFMVSFTSEMVYIKAGEHIDPEHHQVLWELPWQEEKEKE